MIKRLFFYFAMMPLLYTTILMAEERSESFTEAKLPATEVEARMRAMMLHELTHGSLQVIHRDFFDEEQTHSIPSASMEDVFKEIDETFSVNMKWLTVNTDVVNFDHQAKTKFEEQAVQSLKSGQRYFEQIEAGRYQYAGAIRLGSQCLKCHVKLRTDNSDRVAGLLISMPIRNAVR